MFTGLIKAVCPVKSAQKLTVDLAELAGAVNIGDSVAINGVCLTATAIDRTVISFDVSGETLERSTISQLKNGSLVNVELAMSAEGRFGGHFVQGHVDGTAKVKNIKKTGEFTEITFAAKQELLKNLITKGSVAVDGISLTVSELKKDSFSVWLIPATINETNLKNIKVGQSVNIETDLIIKAVKSQLASMLGKEEKLSAEKLRQIGF